MHFFMEWTRMIPSGVFLFHRFVFYIHLSVQFGHIWKCFWPRGKVSEILTISFYHLHVRLVCWLCRTVCLCPTCSPPVFFASSLFAIRHRSNLLSRLRFDWCTNKLETLRHRAPEDIIWFDGTFIAMEIDSKWSSLSQKALAMFNEIVQFC